MLLADLFGTVVWIFREVSMWEMIPSGVKRKNRKHSQIINSNLCPYTTSNSILGLYAGKDLYLLVISDHPYSSWERKKKGGDFTNSRLNINFRKNSTTLILKSNFTKQISQILEANKLKSYNGQIPTRSNTIFQIN